MLKLSLFAACSLVLASHSYAATDCSNATDQAAMTKCVIDDLAVQDKELNVLYKKVEKRLADDHDTKKLLIDSQRAWISFRDSECKFATSSTDGGSIHPMMVASCKAELTTARNQQLSNYLNCEEGDLSCPLPSE